MDIQLIQDVIFHALLVDDDCACLEQRCRVESYNRPGDVYHLNFTNGQPAYFDISVWNTMQTTYILKSSTITDAGEEEKDIRHEAEVAAMGGLFYPLVVESFGFWTPTSLAVLKAIASKTTTKTRMTFSQAFSNRLEQLSVRLWQFNARMVNARLATELDVELWDLPTVVAVS